MIQLGNWQFNPGLFPSLVTLMVFPVLVSLGFWQLDRADQKQRMFNTYTEYRNESPVELDTKFMQSLNDENMYWRQVVVKGVHDKDYLFLLDNQSHNRQAGYLVFSLIRLSQSGMYVLVNRGWINAGTDRQYLPMIEMPTGEISITGETKDVPATGIFLGKNPIEKMTDNSYRLQRIRLSEIEELTGYKLLPFIVRLRPGSEHGFVREWPEPGSGKEKHLGYAFQWFALALTLLVIYVVVNTSKVSGND